MKFIEIDDLEARDRDVSYRIDDVESMKIYFGDVQFMFNWSKIPNIENVKDSIETNYLEIIMEVDHKIEELNIQRKSEFPQYLDSYYSRMIANWELKKQKLTLWKNSLLKVIPNTRDLKNEVAFKRYWECAYDILKPKYYIEKPRSISEESDPEEEEKGLSMFKREPRTPSFKETSQKRKDWFEKSSRQIPEFRDQNQAEKVNPFAKKKQQTKSTLETAEEILKSEFMVGNKKFESFKAAIRMAKISGNIRDLEQYMHRQNIEIEYDIWKQNKKD